MITTQQERRKAPREAQNYAGTERRRWGAHSANNRSADKSPTQKRTLSDLEFAEMYLQHVAKQQNPETRARASVLLATITMLDAKRPTWRLEFLNELAARGIDPKIEEIFPLPVIDEQHLFNEFMSNVLDRKK